MADTPPCCEAYRLTVDQLRAILDYTLANTPGNTLIYTLNFADPIPCQPSPIRMMLKKYRLPHPFFMPFLKPKKLVLIGLSDGKPISVELAMPVSSVDDCILTPVITMILGSESVVIK